MKNRFTKKKWFIAGLLLLMCLPYARAQYPKLLKQFPVTSGVNTIAQKGDVVYLGGVSGQQFNSSFAFGYAYNKVGDSAPNPDFVQPNKSVDAAIPDGAGGFYVFGDPSVTYQTMFQSVGGVVRGGLARINADGTLNDWGTGVTLNQGLLYIRTAVKVGNYIVVGADHDGYPLTLLDANTGQMVTDWNGLTLPIASASKMIVSNNKLYILGLDMSFKQNSLFVLDISDPSHPALINSFKMDAQASDGTPLTISDFIVQDNTIYVTGYQFTSATNLNYQNKTFSGQTFNSSLFAIDATTGAFIKSFNAPLVNADLGAAIAIDGDKLFFTYHSGKTSKLVAYDILSGDDLTSSLPNLQLIAASAPEFLIDFPSANYNKLTITANHQLIIYGGFDHANGTAQTIAAIDLPSNKVVDWHPNTSQLNESPSVVSIGPLVVTESGGKLYVGGGIRLFTSSFERNGLAAINANTGEVLPWAPSELSGTVNSLAVDGNTLYVGGTFSGDHKNLLAYDITDPANPVIKTGWTPSPGAAVNALLVNGGKLYVGGDFTTIEEQPVIRLAEYDVSGDHPVLNTAWNPAPDGLVKSLAVLDNKLYTGGSFRLVGDSPRSAAASFDLLKNNALTTWNPNIGAEYGILAVNAIAVQQADAGNHAARVFLAGFFNQAGASGATVPFGIVAVNTTDGALDPWQLGTPFPFIESGQGINALAIAGNTLYAGGTHLMNSANVSGNFAQADATNYLYAPDAAMNNPLQNDVKAILPAGNKLYIGGTFGGTNQPALGDPLLTGFAVFQTGDLVPELTFSDITVVYGDEPFAPAATSTVTDVPITYSIADGDNPDNAISLGDDGRITILKPGTATITASQSGAVDVKAKITVSKAELTIHPQDTTSVIKQPLPEFSFTLTGWKGEDETKTGIYSGKPEFTTDATTDSPEGTYTVTVSGAGTLTSDYYTFIPAADETATLTIHATGDTPQTITFPALAAKTYGDADFDPTAATDATGLAVTYTSSDESIVTIVDGKIHISGAGTVTITASQAGDATYAPGEPVEQTLTVAKAALTITADDKTINRGDALPDFTATYTGLVNGDEATDLATAPKFTTTATQASGPGTYPISVADAASGNYEIAYANGTLTIKGTQVITWAPLSTLTYGDAPFDPGAASDAGTTFTPVYTTDNPQVIAIANGQAEIKGAGTATITATFAAAGGFERTTSTLKVTVLKKPLTITADDQTRGFGEADPVFTLSYNGFVNGDTYSTPGTLTSQPSAGTTATSTSPVGNYPITVSGATSDNYQISVVPGTLHITALARTLTYKAIPAKTYGNPDFDIASLSSGETPAYTFSDPSVATVLDGRIHIQGAGSTDITVSAPANANYNAIEPVTQTLTVSKAPLIITADNKTKTQGPPDITLTASYSGFINGDNQLNLLTLPLLTTTAKPNSPTGEYPITASGASSPNYDISYQPGTLTIILAVGQDELTVDQALSPNGDGINDYFQIGGIENFPTNHVIILNRNGSKVYEVDGYDNANKKFDGRSSQSGSYLQQGTYYYLISYKVDGQEKKAKGYLILKY